MSDPRDPNPWQDQDFLRSSQYKNADNLSARNDLHSRFSTNPYGWRRWLFDHILALGLPAQAQVLELGAGPGWLWKDSRDRVPAGWQIVLSDVSPGMVEAAQRNLADSGLNLTFETVDIQAIPFEAATFDLVMAHHMLYHVPDLPAALAEVRRVLRPGGCFVAATNGEDHLKELRALVEQVGWPGMHTRAFRLEDGAEKLAPYFESVRVERYPDGLRITEAEPVVQYAVSALGTVSAEPAAVAQFRTLVQHLIAAQRVFRVSKDSGLFIARRD